MILIILLYALFASSFSMGKVLLGYTTPIFLTGIRMFLGGGLLLAYQYFYAHEQFKFKKKHIKYYAQIIIFGMYLAYILRFWALEYMTSTKVALLYNLQPFFASIYSYFLFSEKLSTKKFIGLIIGFAGLVPILLTSSTSEQNVGELFFISGPELAAILAAAAHSYSWIVMRKLVKDKSYSPTMINGLTMLCAGVFGLITSFIVEGPVPQIHNGLPGFIMWLVLVILISNLICYNLYAHLLRSYTATFLSFASFITPLFTALYGWLFLRETVTWHFYVSNVIILIGLFFFYQEELLASKKTPEQPFE